MIRFMISAWSGTFCNVAGHVYRQLTEWRTGLNNGNIYSMSFRFFQKYSPA